MPDRREFLRLGVGAVGAAGAVAGLSGLQLASAAQGAGSAVRHRTTGRTDWEMLRRHLAGDVVLPADAGYDRARQLAHGEYDRIRPRAVVYAETDEDVRTAIRFAQDNDLHTVPRSGGHSLGGYSTTRGVVLDVSRLNRIDVTRSGTVVAGAGVQQVDGLRPLAARGLALVGGRCPNVALGGYVQGGGIGWQTRRHGLGSDRLVRASVVLPDGRLVRASAEEHADLFWALQGGGGGNFGVVTRYELRPSRVRTMVNYALTWPWEAADRVLRAWQEWVAAGPRDLGAALALVHADSGTGTPVVLVNGGWLAGEEDLERQLNALVAEVGTAPATRAVEEKPYAEAMMAWYECTDLSVEQCHRIGYSPEAQLPRLHYFHNRNRLYARSLPAAQVDRLLDVFTAAPRAGQFRLLDFIAIGGRANDRPRTETAYVHRTACLMGGFSGGLNDPGHTPEDQAACDRWMADGFAALNPNSLRESYQNFIDPDLDDWRGSYYAENYPRLRRIKQRYDPHGFFRFAQGVR